MGYPRNHRSSPGTSRSGPPESSPTSQRRPLMQTPVQTNAAQRNGTGHHPHHLRPLRMPFRTDATTPDRTVRHPDQEPFNPKVLGSSPRRPMARDRCRRARTDAHRLPARLPNLGRGQTQGSTRRAWGGTISSPTRPGSQGPMHVYRATPGVWFVSLWERHGRCGRRCGRGHHFLSGGLTISSPSMFAGSLSRGRG